jgi:DNA-binding CsgD family transcriptional regulator
MGLTKGVRMTNLHAFVAQRFGIGAWEALIEPLAAPDRAVLGAVVAAGWYDHALRARLVRGLSARFGAAVAVALGRYEADLDLTTVHRWFLRLVRPSFAIRNMNHYWRRSDDSGRWTSEVRDGVIVARLHGWEPVEPALCHTLQGYLGRTLELLGGGDVTVEHTRCRAGGDPYCEFRTADFRAEGCVRWSDTAVTPGDLPSIAYELTQLTDLEAVTEAIVEVLSRRLSFSYVAVHVCTEPGREPRLVRTAGRSGAGVPCCFVLQTGGTNVGRLDVEVPEGRSDAEVLDPILSCFAVALRSAGACPVPDSAPPSAEQRSHRTDAAARRWGLTPRQRETLDLVVQGLTNKEIAADLGCQEGTVEVHVSQILKKSGAGNRAGLVGKVWSED